MENWGLRSLSSVKFGKIINYLKRPYFRNKEASVLLESLHCHLHDTVPHLIGRCGLVG